MDDHEGDEGDDFLRWYYGGTPPADDLPAVTQSASLTDAKRPARQASTARHWSVGETTSKLPASKAVAPQPSASIFRHFERYAEPVRL